MVDFCYSKTAGIFSAHIRLTVRRFNIKRVYRYLRRGSRVTVDCHNGGRRITFFPSTRCYYAALDKRAQGMAVCIWEG